MHMFLQSLRRTNPNFITTAINLHQEGQIPANSYVLDLDVIAENARHIAAEARKHNVEVFPMPKQFGRNPEGPAVSRNAGREQRQRPWPRGRGSPDLRGGERRRHHAPAVDSQSHGR